ncbi:hypothetical protein ACPV3A_29525 [Paenibacillus sp. Dod16]|uniref:hypothetical protein n=1 Tax=Paenibacillus sp. Dod16 TaxID=3416392 RepID=UPI003CECBF6C
MEMRDLLQDLEALRQDEEGDITEFVYDVIAPHAIQRAIDAEAREKKLREAIDKAIREYGLWHDEGSAANVMVEILHNAVSSLYPKEETK